MKRPNLSDDTRQLCNFFIQMGDHQAVLEELRALGIPWTTIILELIYLLEDKNYPKCFVVNDTLRFCFKNNNKSKLKRIVFFKENDILGRIYLIESRNKTVGIIQKIIKGNHDEFYLLPSTTPLQGKQTPL